MAKNVINISTVLKRKLKDGKEYSKLIPRVSCKTTPLGDGDTFFTVDRMQDWIEKFRHQTAKLAVRLEGRTVEETVNNIYNFLYNHIQYTADGSLQQLRSPACTWMQRKKGTDCKSYSVFASCILSNLGIKHAIRQVRQSYFYPEEFTHVYVVVPKDQSKENYDNTAPTFVLDATKHENTEVNYLEKVDLYMNKLKHVGLNAPQDERTANIVNNFEEFCQHLLKVGVPVSVVNSMRERVSQFTSQGKDPKFKIIDRGIEIEGKLFVLNFSNNKKYQEGLGLVDPVSVSGYAAAGKALLAMLPADFFGNTFGSIFANGFDLSCWNASYSESKASAALQEDIPFLVNDYANLGNSPTEANLNKFLNGIAGYIADSQNGQKSKFAKCTRKGYALRQQGSETARETVLNTFKSTYNLIPNGKKPGHVKVKMPSYDGRMYEWGHTSTSVYEYDSYRLEEKRQTSMPNPSTGGSGNPQQKSGGSNTGLIIGGVALAALPLFFMMKKGSVAANTPVKKAPAKKAKK